MFLINCPSEILEKIIRSESISHQDLLSFSSTCSRFKEIGNNNDVWREKFKLSFEELHFPIQDNSQLLEINWKEEFRKRLDIGAKVGKELDKLSSRFFRRTELSFSDFRWFDDLLLAHNPSRSHAHLHLVDKLTSLLDDDQPHLHLTDKYYAGKVVSQVRHKLLVGSRLRGEDAGDLLTYEGALVLVSQWCQPARNVSEHKVSRLLDRLAEKVMADLLERHPEHPIFEKVRSEQENSSDVCLTRLLSLCSEMGEQSLWSSPDCLSILTCCSRVMFREEGLGGNRQSYYHPHNSFVDRVLETKRGIPITLCIIHHCVLRRLGVATQPVNFPGHFLLKWLEHPEAEREEARFTMIDSFEGGKHLSPSQARERMAPGVVGGQDNYRVASPRDTACRMLRNLISIGASRSNDLSDGNYSLLRCALELMLHLNMADNMQFAFMLSRVYLQLNINHEEVLHMLQEYRDNPGISDQVDYLMTQCQLQLDNRGREDQATEPTKRGVAASFPHGVPELWVGQVCQHRVYHYYCVVYGWDPVCTASRSWISQMGVDRLERQDKQPFYNVLVSDGSTRYAAQDNLEPCQPCLVTHPEVGKYFTAFRSDLGYVANRQLAADYPDEKQVIKSFTEKDRDCET